MRIKDSFQQQIGIWSKNLSPFWQFSSLLGCKQGLNVNFNFLTRKRHTVACACASFEPSRAKIGQWSVYRRRAGNARCNERVTIKLLLFARSLAEASSTNCWFDVWVLIEIIKVSAPTKIRRTCLGRDRLQRRVYVQIYSLLNPFRRLRRDYIRYTSDFEKISFILCETPSYFIARESQNFSGSAWNVSQKALRKLASLRNSKEILAFTIRYETKFCTVR